MIQFRDVTKDFKGNVVLSDISMEIKDKELTVLIGPSGCGKTTTLKMINRLIQPSKGNIFIDGKNIEEMDKVQLRRNMGYVIQQGGLFPHMTVRQNIEIIERLEKKDPQAIVDNTVRLMKMVDLNPEAFLDRYPTELSGGQRQRLFIVLALIPKPEVVFLDELTTGLDARSRRDVWKILADLKEMGLTIFLTSHFMDEVEVLCDQICILKRGKIVFYGTVAEAIRQSPYEKFEDVYLWFTDEEGQNDENL